MGDYISREAAIDVLCRIACGNVACGQENCTAYDNMKAIPAADVRHVTNGEWIGEDCSYWRCYHSGARPVRRIRYRCSVCGRTENWKEPFCNCGADMRPSKETK